MGGPRETSSRYGFEFDGVVRITRLGTAYLLFTFLVGLSALNTGYNSLYIALSMMLGSLLVSGVLSQRGLEKLSVHFESAESPWAGTSVTGYLVLRNSSRFLRPRDIILIAAELDEAVLVRQVRRKRDQVVQVLFRFPRRGRTRLQSVDVYSRYPFGLFLKKRRLPLEGEVIVFPRLLTLEEQGEAEVRRVGEFREENRAGRGSDVFAFRDYAPGDSLRHVHWKKSARIGRWILRQPQAESDRSLHIAVDHYVPEPLPLANFETEVSRAATVIYQALKQGQEVTLHLSQGSIRSAQAGMNGMMEALALLEATREQVTILTPPGTLWYRVRGGEDGAQVA